uniref:Uncharacterized protein n=1 Tax=Anguilla anguilla TaxID=7936 RepID=A0A0E9SAL2_ANGAN
MAKPCTVHTIRARQNRILTRENNGLHTVHSQIIYSAQ